jgi:hypothetical protein
MKSKRCAIPRASAVTSATAILERKSTNSASATTIVIARIQPCQRKK